ncbi:hypothetical protein [Tautonia marina]|uniref:hypothetical protein n=1 Tax=Tautonia marina TaxID=2653855 RepID=UPI00137606DD|nr:hypothetical protein [Tautonia marina]
MRRLISRLSVITLCLLFVTAEVQAQRGRGGGGARGGGGGARGGGGGMSQRGGGGFSGGGMQQRGGGGFSGGGMQQRGGGGFSGGGMSQRGMPQGGGYGGGMQQRGEYGGGMQQRGGFGGGLPTTSQPVSRGTAAAGPFGGSGTGQRTSRSATGPGGGQFQAGSGSGSYTTNRGGTIDYGGAGAAGTGPGGVSAGRGAYGIQGTTAGGRDYTNYGRVGGVSGPGGNTVAGRSSVGSVTGDRGTAYGASRGVAGVGPEGAFGGTQRAGVASGERGTIASGSRAGFATGPEGTIAGGSRGAIAGNEYGAVGRSRGTFYASSGDLAARGDYARRAYVGAPYFTPNWMVGYPNAWIAPATMATAAALNWATLANYCGYPAQPAYYDYGGNVVYQGDAMYIDGNVAGTPEQYADQASQLAASGGEAPADPNADWQLIGVFGIAPPDDTPPNEFFQLAINPQGVLRGNYYNSSNDTVIPIAGAVDNTTYRAAWSIGDQPVPVFDVGIANLTKDETTMLIHDQEAQPIQVTLVRMPPSSPGNAPQGGAPPTP